MLMTVDRWMSDLPPGKDSAKLCSHHDALYKSACLGRKCSVTVCLEEIKGAVSGVPYCKKHYHNASSSRSPSPAPRPKESTPGARKRSPSVQFDAEEGQGESEAVRPPTPPLRRSTSEGPPAHLAKAEAALYHHKECLVKLRLSPHGGEAAWYLFLGEVTGTASDARST